MPDLHLSEEDARAIAEWLRSAAMVGSIHAAMVEAAGQPRIWEKQPRFRVGLHSFATNPL